MSSQGRGPRKLLVVANEPTPYNSDLFNALACWHGWQTTVMYVKAQNWDKDAGHDYRVLPTWRHEAVLCDGAGPSGQVVAAIRTLRLHARLRPDALLICGYHSPAHIAAILAAGVARIPYAFWVDRLNVGRPMRGSWPTRTVRDGIRSLVFNTARAVLVCGRQGRAAALAAGCPEEKVMDFPYVVDERRLREQAEANPPIQGWNPEKWRGRTILFSGRLIPRKGLDVLLGAVARLRDQRIEFFLVIEGDGPKRSEYELRVAKEKLIDRIWFAGFRQMHEHSFLLASADIIVVPSLRDPWGLVVHEGMLMGKPVCASDATGAGADRIRSGVNGFLFPSGDEDALAHAIARLLAEDGLRRQIGAAARLTALEFTPERNANVLLGSVFACPRE